jgi:hypothetical protein
MIIGCSVVTAGGFGAYPVRGDSPNQPDRPNPENPVNYYAWVRSHLIQSDVSSQSTRINVNTWADGLTPPPSIEELQAAAAGPWQGKAGLAGWLENSKPTRSQMSEELHRLDLNVIIDLPEQLPEGFTNRWNGGLITAVIPGLEAVRVWAMSELAEGWREFQSSNETRLVESVGFVVRAARQLESCHTFDARVLGDSLSGLAYETMLQSLARSQDKAVLAGEFRNRVIPHDLPASNLDKAYQFEQISAIDTVQRLFLPAETEGAWKLDESANHVYNRLVRMNGGGSYEEWSRAREKLLAAGFDQSITDLTRYFIKIHQWRQTRYRTGLDYLYAFHDDVSGHENPLIRLYCVNLTSPEQYHRRTIALRHGTRLLVHLILHQSEYGSLPETLSQLKNLEDLAEIREDPFSESEFVYLPIRDGFLLYSLGEDGKDDGGRPQPNPDRPGDLVLWSPNAGGR